jgi:transcriptional regulator with XRE-family HTH domain
MSTRDEEFSQLLRASLRLKKRPPATDADVEEFLSTPDDDPESVERVRAHFVEESFLRIHRKPVRQIMDVHVPSFGQWAAEARRKTHLPRKQIARVLKQEPAFVERLESGETPPWQCDAGAVAALVKLYRLHINAVESLIRNTEGSLLPPAPPPAVRPEPRAEGMQTYMLDRPGGQREFRPEVARWLSDLRAALQRLQATDLLSF